jgi:hypothetical protein
MKKNMGTLDRAIRVLLAVAIIALYVLGYIPGTWTVVLLILAGIFIVTSLAGVCPLYLPFGIRTNRDKLKSVQ